MALKCVVATTSSTHSRKKCNKVGREYNGFCIDKNLIHELKCAWKKIVRGN
jgi:hypothetical protein